MVGGSTGAGLDIACCPIVQTVDDLCWQVSTTITIHIPSTYKCNHLQMIRKSYLYRLIAQFSTKFLNYDISDFDVHYFNAFVGLVDILNSKLF